MNLVLQTWGGGIFSKMYIALDYATRQLTDDEIDNIKHVRFEFNEKESACKKEYV